MKRKSQFHAESELLKLLDTRFKTEGLGDGREYRKPDIDPIIIDRAARAHAEVIPSDPFAYGRMRLHLAQGYELVSDVMSDVNRQRSVHRGHAAVGPDRIAA